VETNPNFDKPVNWDTIVADCVKALAAVGLDVAAFDVRVQSTKNGKGQNRPDPKYIILESNSAPSFGTITTQKYLGVLPQLITDKL
jgi:glutathione synthase/RimK-type ligase-like ATP-grasp enzyme